MRLILNLTGSQLTFSDVEDEAPFCHSLYCLLFVAHLYQLQLLSVAPFQGECVYVCVWGGSFWNRGVGDGLKSHPPAQIRNTSYSPHQQPTS